MEGSTRPQDREKSVKVAVIGSGLAGLTVANALATASTKSAVIERARRKSTGSQDSQTRSFDVRLFERSEKLGLDAASVEVPLYGAGEESAFHLDTPMRAVQGGYYRSVLSLYKRLGVRLKVADFNYSFLRLAASASSKGASEIALEAAFIYEGGNGLRLRPIGFPASLFPERTFLASPTKLASAFRSLIEYLCLCLLITLGYLQLVVLAGLHHHARRRRHSRLGALARRTGVVAEQMESEGGEALEEWSSRWRIPERLSRDVVEPLFCCVCTCSREEVRAYPAAEILDYIWLTFGAKHYVCADGVASVVQALTAPIPPSAIHLGAAGSIVSLERIPGSDHTGKRWRLWTADGLSTTVDKVVFATQANHARSLLGSSTDVGLVKERDAALATFEYCSTVVANHYDAAAVLPASSPDLRDLNILLDDPNYANIAGPKRSAPPSPASSQGEETPPPPYHETDGAACILDPGYVMATHVLTRTHSNIVSSLGSPLLLSEKPTKSMALLQTTNPTVPINRTQVISETWFERAKVTRRSRRALKDFLLPTGDEVTGEEDLGMLQGLDDVWFCGSWCAEGIPLLEGCVVSAEGVAQALIRETMGS